MKLPGGPFAAALLALPSLAYRGIVRLRNRRYDRPGATRRLRLPVVSVGNLTVGGTGKTPLVGWLADHLRDAGRRPAIVSRGYGGRASEGPRVVSLGQGPLCRAGDCGDEPFLLARDRRGTIIVVGSDRVLGAETAASLGADVVILDDGFQHRRLARDLDLVLIDAGAPFGNGRLLPAGPLREPLSSLARAGVVVVTRCSPETCTETIATVVRRYNPTAPIVRASHRSLGLYDLRGALVPPPALAVAFCGIGNPTQFRADLEATPIRLAAFREFRDHHRYSRGELEELLRLARRHDAPLITTEKDVVRLGAMPVVQQATTPILARRIEPFLLDPEPLLRALAAAIERSTR